MTKARGSSRWNKLPGRIRVTPRVSYRVGLVPDLSSEPKIMGEFYDTVRLILLRGTLPDRELRLYLFHELLHAVSDVYDLGLTEKQVAGIERAFRRILRLNPGLRLF